MNLFFDAYTRRAFDAGQPIATPPILSVDRLRQRHRRFLDRATRRRSSRPRACRTTSGRCRKRDGDAPVRVQGALVQESRERRARLRPDVALRLEPLLHDVHAARPRATPTQNAANGLAAFAASTTCSRPRPAEGGGVASIPAHHDPDGSACLDFEARSIVFGAGITQKPTCSADVTTTTRTSATARIPVSPTPRPGIPARHPNGPRQDGSARRPGSTTETGGTSTPTRSISRRPCRRRASIRGRRWSSNGDAGTRDRRVGSARRARLRQEGAAAPDASADSLRDGYIGRPAPAGRTGRGERAAMGLAVPRDMRLLRVFDDSAVARGRVVADAVSNYVRRRVDSSTAEIGAARTVFPGTCEGPPADKPCVSKWSRLDSTVLLPGATHPHAATPGLSETSAGEKRASSPANRSTRTRYSSSTSRPPRSGPAVLREEQAHGGLARWLTYDRHSVSCTR